MLACSAPPSVDSSVSAERDPRSRFREVGGSTVGHSRSCTSQSSLSRSRESREGCRHARSQSGGSRARSSKSRSCSTTHSRSRGCGRSRRGSSRSPSARMWSRLSRSRSSDRYWVRQVCSQSLHDHSRS